MNPKEPVPVPSCGHAWACLALDSAKENGRPGKCFILVAIFIPIFKAVTLAFQSRAGIEAANTASRVAAFAFLLCVSNAAAELAYPLRWRWSNPLPHGNNIISMAYYPPLNRAVQVTERGQIYTSDNLLLWTRRESGLTNALRGVTFFGTRLVIVGEGARILWSDDHETFFNASVSGVPERTFFQAVAASSSLLVAVGSGGIVVTSPTGTNWTKVPAFTSRPFNSVAYGAAGFVAVTDDGYVFQSGNGLTWQPRFSAAAHWNCVISTGNRYLAVGDNGHVIVSQNGTDWTPEPTGATNELHAAAAASIGSTFTARLVTGSNEVRLTETGMIGWSDELAQGLSPPAWTYLSALGRPGFFLLGGRTGLIAEGYRTNGTDPYIWITPTDTLRPWLFDVTYASNIYVAVGDRATILTSGNGVDWNLEVVPAAATNTLLLGIGGNDNVLAAAGANGKLLTSSNEIVAVPAPDGSTNYISTFGVIWNDVAQFTTNDLQGIAALRDTLVVTGDNGTIFVSTNGSAWMQVSTPTTNFLSSVASYPGGLVATGERGTILHSVDAFTWTTNHWPTANWIWKVRYVGGKLVAVGQNGLILTSDTGQSWSSAASGTPYWLHDVTCVTNTWFAFGKFGTFLSSTNAVDWTPRDIITLKSLYAAASDSRQLITVGLEGIILRAQVLPDLADIRILGYQRVMVTNPPSINNVFLFGGKADQRFTLDFRSALDTNVWVTGPILEFYDSSGTLFYLDTLPPNPPMTEFYRMKLVP